MIFVNFKIYKSTFGDKAVEMARFCQEVAEETGVEIIPIVSPFELREVKKEVGGEVFVQKVDEYSEGKWTGAISPIQAKENGASGTVLNHFENQIPLGTAAKISKELPNKFKVLLCVRSLKQAKKWVKKITPDYLAYEPGYLIASKDKSVSTEKPEIIANFAKEFKDIPVLAGAGVRTSEDVRIALELGAKGVILSSGVTCADNPEEALKELAKGFLAAK